jgi:drug/metabolite transporter (DMT)-like permease
MNKNLVSHYKAELMLVLMTAIWGATFLVTAEGLEFATPLLYNALRFALAFLLTLVVFFKKLKFRDKEILRSGSILGLIFGVGFALQTYALSLTTISKTAFITALTVVLTPFFYKIITGKNPRFWPRIGIVVAFTGLVIFTFPFQEYEGIPFFSAIWDFIASFNPGDFMAILSCLCWALYITLMDKYTKHRDSFSFTISLVSVQFFVVMIVNAILALVLTGSEMRLDLNNDLLLSLAFNGILASFVVTLIHTYYQKHTTPVKAALIFSLEPVFASIIAFIAIGEILGYRESWGAAILMVGVLISEMGLMIQKAVQKRLA